MKRARIYIHPKCPLWLLRVCVREFSHTRLEGRGSRAMPDPNNRNLKMVF